MNERSISLRPLQLGLSLGTSIFVFYLACLSYAWFDFKGCDRYEIEEQSFLLPDDEISTVLKLPDVAIA
jgi:hypothetical protein